MTMLPTMPVDCLEEVASCLADVLGLEQVQVAPDALLTELGLESFTAVRLRRRLREDLDVDLALTDFLEGATARSVAAAVASARATVSQPHPITPETPVLVAGPGDAGAEPLALTPIQAAYLVGRDPAFPLGGVATFFYFEYDRDPAGDPQEDLVHLEVGWNALVARHPMLRMVIDADANPRVLDSVPAYRIAVTDLRDASAEEANGELVRLRAECSHQLRPVDVWPLFDLRAALLPDGRTRLYVGMDIIALDLASWMLLMREWGQLAADRDAGLAEPSTTFAALMRRRERDPAEVARRARDRDYWARRAPTLPPGPALPWTKPTHELGVPRFTRHPGELTADDWAGLRRRAAARGLTPTAVLLAACGLVLHRWGATAPFCLNTTLFDRPDTGEDGVGAVVGDFTTTVLSESPALDLTGWAGFMEYAAAVNRWFWTDLEHRSVSAVEALRDRRGGDLTPVYPVVFTSGVGLAGEDGAPTAWLGREVFGVSQTPQVLIDHIVWDEAGRLRIAWDAVDGCLPVDLVSAIRDAHLHLLRRLAHDDAAWSDPALGWDPSFLPDQALDCAPFAGAGELLDDPLRVAAARIPDAVALFAGEPVTHGELAGRAGRTAIALAGMNIGPGDLVAVAAPKGAPQIAAVLGVSAAGAGYVPVEPAWPASRIASVCAQAGIRHALVAGDVDAQWPAGVRVHQLATDGTLTGGSLGAAPVEPPRPEPSELAYAIFTSGSTGQPKGVAVEHRQARTTLDDLADRFPMTPDDRVLALSAMSFDLSVYDVYAVLGAGGAMVLPAADRERDPGHWLELMATHRVTIWNTAPALLEMLVEYAEMDPDGATAALSTLRLVLLSGDWIPVTLPDRLRALAPDAQVVSLGGATEGSIWSICYPIGAVDPSWPSIPYGRALRGQSFHILDDKGRPCPVGVPGELYIGGAGVARGYIGDPPQTADRFTTHPLLRRRLYRTGDLGRWRVDGNIEFLGRVDRQVKIRGHRIELGEVESVLDRTPGVRQCVARSVPGPDGRPRLVAYVAATDPAAAPAEEELIARLRANLPEYMVPSRFVYLAALPVTGNGKVDHAALPNPYRTAEPAMAVDTPPAVTPQAVTVQAVTVQAVTVPVGDRADAATLTLDELLHQAAHCGLDVRVSVGGGDLEASAALAAAADLAAAAGRLTRAVIPHLGEGRDLLQLVLTATRPEVGSVNGAQPVLPQPGSLDGLPDPEIERAVAAVFSDLLGGPVDVNTPFFRLGATSLTLVLAHRRLTAQVDAELSVVDLFARPTVRELARWLSSGRNSPAPVRGLDTVAPNASQVTTPSRRQARALAAEAAR